MIGGLAWVVSTSVLLVGLPYMLAVEDEGRLVQQEREYNQQQAGASVSSSDRSACEGRRGGDDRWTTDQEGNGFKTALMSC